MKFDVVIGNPPYNNDIYIPFVEMGHEISTDYSVFITPGRWQAKGGDINDKFRDEIVPYMNKIVYYPDAGEIFDISLKGGISYYIIDKKVHEKQQLKTICTVQKLFETNGIEKFKFDGVLYNSKVRGIIKKLGTYKQLYCENRPIDGKYNVAFTSLFTDDNLCNKQGTANVLLRPYIQTTLNKKCASTTFIKTFETEQEATSLISYLDTKFIRFMFLVGRCGKNSDSRYVWKYIPDPLDYNHIFTDDELYKKYGLDDNEIDMIEKIIRARK